MRKCLKIVWKWLQFHLLLLCYISIFNTIHIQTIKWYKIGRNGQNWCYLMTCSFPATWNFKCARISPDFIITRDIFFSASRLTILTEFVKYGGIFRLPEKLYWSQKKKPMSILLEFLHHQDILSANPIFLKTNFKIYCILYIIP